MQRTLSAMLTILVTAACLALAGCILTPAGIQLLELHFAVKEALAAGEQALVHQQVLPAELVLKKYFVRGAAPAATGIEPD